MAALMEVTQADRDAAADLIEWQRGPYASGRRLHVPDEIRAGLRDGSGTVQAFARHRLAHSEPRPVAGHSDDEAVDRFAALMKAKLAAARDKGRGGWDDPAQCSTDFLRQLLHEHVAKGDPVDVANFCMMLAHYGASTATHSPAPTEAERAEAVLAAFNGGMVRVPEPSNPRGYIDYYRPLDAMRHALSSTQGGAEG